MYTSIIFVFFIQIGFIFVNGNLDESSAEYLGCYEDDISNRLMSDRKQNFPGTLTPNKCINYCKENGFAYAGTQYSYECFCSRKKPPGLKKALQSDCNAKCAGDASKTCGGNNRLAVYTTGHPASTESSVSYLGCFKDNISDRLLKDHHQDFHETLTPQKCNEHCREKGFGYAGTQYSFECFCSKTKPSDLEKTLQSECNSKCDGDSSKTCGGDNRLAVYSTGLAGSTGYGEELSLLIGCFKDSGKERFFPEYRQDFPRLLTNQLCVKLCKKTGYLYAGTEYGRECYCGNRKPSYKDYAYDEECSKNCEGDVNQVCGGNRRISVFKTSASGDSCEAGNYIGCYNDQADPRALEGLKQDFKDFLTPFKCTGFCHSKGFLYSGTQYGSECFCGDYPPSPITKVDDKECNKPCSGNVAEMCGGDYKNSIRETGIPDVPVTDKYVGCFNDQDNQIFKDVKVTFEKTNTPRRCMNYCSHLGYKYSGVEYGRECFCGNNSPKEELVVKQEECDMVCSGDPFQSCGSGWRLAIYSTTLAEPGVSIKFPINPTTSRPCEPTKTVVNGNKPVCKGDVIFEDKFNTLETNWQHIVMMPDDPPREELEEYHTLQNDQKKYLLSHDSLFSSKEESLEFIGLFTDKTAGTEEIKEFEKTICSRIQKLNCSNQVVAKNKINNILLELEKEESRHMRKVNGSGMSGENLTLCPDAEEIPPHPPSSGPQIYQEEEYEKAVFTDNSANSYTKNNRLIIKPTIMDDDFVLTGFLHLNGCTGRPDSRQCELKASGYNILPPVTTARIHTRESFSFRYGIIEIRARLPLGDWLVPELWLQPKRNRYGPGYASGRMRIAVSRGNNDFRCDGEDMGSTFLESGIVMGSSNNVKKRSQTVKVPRNWHDNFHNFTIIWTSESISFKIDNGPTQDIVPAGKSLCNFIGFENHECSPWNRGSGIAPFDEEFYISLGLSVGSARDFPDGCTNNGQPKPWNNTDPKGMLNFWRDKENWKATWTDEGSALYVEHVRVTAL